MKKLFTLLFVIIASAMTAMATDYTDNLIITIDNGKPTTVNDVKITVTQQENGKYSFSLKDFSFAGARVGDIELNDIEGQEKDRIITLNVPKTNAVYIGDSDVDFNTAANSELKFIGVAWGFKGHDFLKELGSKFVVDTADELTKLIISK